MAELKTIHDFHVGDSVLFARIDANDSLYFKEMLDAFGKTGVISQKYIDKADEENGGRLLVGFDDIYRSFWMNPNCLDKIVSYKRREKT